MIQFVVLIGSIFPVEKALKENFDDNGNMLKSYEERSVKYMQDYFEKDRYNFSQLINEIRIMKVVDDVIIDKETGIEIYEGNKVPKDILIGILQEFSAMDNLVQDECKNEYEEKDFNIDNYLFAPAWIRISDNEVVVGYWGIKINSSFDKVFVKKDGKWKIKFQTGLVEYVFHDDFWEKNFLCNDGLFSAYDVTNKQTIACGFQCQKSD